MNNKSFTKSYCENCKKITKNKIDNFFNKDLRMTVYSCEKCYKVKFLLYFNFNTGYWFVSKIK